MMNSPQTRPGRFHQGHQASAVPLGQTRALQRRQALEAQQRTFRVGESAGSANSAADLTPVRLRPRGTA
jgi:hypothetical protein